MSEQEKDMKKLSEQDMTKLSEQEQNVKELTEQELQENKAIEQAYQAEMLTEIPDLWDRIESALPEKTPSETFQTESQTESQTEKQPNAKKVLRFRYVKTAALIAAGICIVLMVPMLLSIGGRKSMSSDMATSESAMDMQSDASAAEAVAEEAPAAEEAAEEMAAAESAPEEENATEADEELAAPASDEAIAGEALTESAATAEDTTEQESVQKELAEDKNSNAAQKQADTDRGFDEDALYTEGVKIEIISQDTTEAGSVDGYCLFTVMVLEDASGMYGEGNICDVYADEEFTEKLKPGKTIIVTVVNPKPTSSSKLELYILEEETAG